jgi:hypothetical protein
LLWYLVGLLAIGILSPYPSVPISRQHFLLPVTATCAGLAVWGVLASIRPWLAPAWRVAAAVPAVGLLLAVVLALNVDRFWHDTPRRLPTTQEAVAMRAILSPECRGLPGRVYVIGPKPEPLLSPALDSYDLGERRPILVRLDRVTSLTAADTEAMSCLVFMGSAQERLPLLQLFSGILPGKTAYVVKDHSGKVEVSVLR